MNMNVTPLLEMRNIHKSFGGVQALEGVGLEVKASEVHALIGQNGAGKSTLIKTLNGAYSKDHGDILLDGSPVAFQSPHQAQLGGVSTIFQEVNLVHLRSVTENIVLGQEPKKQGMIDWKNAHKMAQAAVSQFGLDIDVRRPLHCYNIAIQQMIAIARAVSFKARLVIMDEPTSSLDDCETEVLFRVIQGLKADGVAILYISHHLDELYEVCDRVTIMRDGRTVSTHSMSDVGKLELVSRMIGRDPKKIQQQGATGFGERRKVDQEVILEVETLSDGHNLTDASFVLHKGEIVGLAGLLGSGRSETARLIFGAETKRGGTLRIAGHDLTLKSPAMAIANGLGFCTEDRKSDGIVPELSVRENLTLALLPKLTRYGIIPVEQERIIVDSFIDKLKIKTTGREQPIRELSGGNQQKVLLSRWMAINPHLLILDEPTRGIDVGAKHEIQKLIDGLAREGVAILMISSEFEELIEGANRVVVLQQGKTLMTIDREALSEESLLQAVASHDTEQAKPEHQEHCPLTSYQQTRKKKCQKHHLAVRQ